MWTLDHVTVLMSFEYFNYFLTERNYRCRVLQSNNLNKYTMYYCTLHMYFENPIDPSLASGSFDFEDFFRKRSLNVIDVDSSDS